MNYWKILNSRYEPPLQGGQALCDGNTWPVELPEVPLDLSDAECGEGWNFCRSVETGFGIAGLWRTGRPNAVVLVEPHGEVIERGNKLRASRLTLIRPATDEEIRAALLEFSRPFGEHQSAMGEEQWLWYQALGRPHRDKDKVVAGLQAALNARGLNWSVKEYGDARDAWAAWAAWDAWDAWAAWAARDALSVQFAARSACITHKHDLLTVGIRDAYFNGLGIAVPTGPNELGFSMEA